MMKLVCLTPSTSASTDPGWYFDTVLGVGMRLMPMTTCVIFLAALIGLFAEPRRDLRA